MQLQGAGNRCAIEPGNEAVVSRAERPNERLHRVGTEHDGELQISVGRGCVTAAGDGLKNGIAVGIAVGVRGERNGVLLARGDPAIARHQHAGDEVRLVAGRPRDLKDIVPLARLVRAAVTTMLTDADFVLSVTEVAVMVTLPPEGMAAGAVYVVADPLAVTAGWNDPQADSHRPPPT